MKTTKLKVIGYLTLLVLVFLSACEKPFNDFLNEQFPEPSNMSSDILIDGEVAVPILDTYLSLENFIPHSDSSFWAEVDSADLVHLKMYFRDVAYLTAIDIYGSPLPTIYQKDSANIRTDTSKLKIYEKALSGHLFFNDPRIYFIFKNEIPIVNFFRLDTLFFHRIDGTAFEHTEDTKYYINAPTQVNTVDTTSVLIDKNRIPGLEDLFSPIPKFVSAFITIGNDQVQTPDPLNPVLPQQKVSLDVFVDLPLDAHLVDLVMGDTINFSLDTNVEEIESVTIKLILDNEFPVGGVSQLSFADTNDNGQIDDIIMNLFPDSGWEFAPAITDPNGTTTSSVVSSIKLVLTQGQIDTLNRFHASKVILTTNLNSYQSHTGQDVKIFGWYKLGAKLGVKVKYNANTGNLPQ